MCGIGGCAVRPGVKPDIAALERVVVSLGHRGPDDSGIEIKRNVGLVNARLAIVDTSPAGHQPMVDRADRWVLSYNGEVFNHRELRRRLSPVAYRGHSDTETLLHALSEWGPAGAAERCNGFFAFAALDAVERKLFLVRDRLGVKPLYLARQDGAVWFASEIRALLAAGIHPSPREDILSHTAGPAGWPYGRPTPLERIERVLPGSLVAIDLESLEISERCWWEPAHAVDPELSRRLETIDREELGDHLETALRGGVRRRLMADVPVGTLCSGGLDSSLVTAFAHDENPSVTAFTASLPDEGREDERRWAEEVAGSLGVELQTISITSSEWRAALVGAISHHEYPLASSTSVPISLIAEEARRRGVKALLTGEAADELFGGYPFRHPALYRDFLPPSAILRRGGHTIRTHGPRWAIRAVVERLPRLIRGQPPLSVNPAAAEVVKRFLEETRATAARAYEHHPGPRGRLEAALLADLLSGPFPFILNRMDKDAMAHSIETRIPFLDPEVMTLSLNLPLEARTEPDPKGVLKEVGRRNLPPAIVQRPKQAGMFVGTRRIEEAARPEFLEDGVLRDLVRFPGSPSRRGLKRASDRHRMHMWTAEIWCRLFLEGQSVRSVERELWVAERM